MTPEAFALSSCLKALWVLELTSLEQDYLETTHVKIRRAIGYARLYVPLDLSDDTHALPTTDCARGPPVALLLASAVLACAR